MFKFNRSTEYGLMALRYLTQKSGTPASAREISRTYDIPYDMTAKTLQKLKEHRYITSSQGPKGGYSLVVSKMKMDSLADFIFKFEGDETLSLCLEDETCDLASRCEMKHMMIEVNAKLLKFLKTIPLTDLTEGKILLSQTQFFQMASDPKQVDKQIERLSEVLGGEP